MKKIALLISFCFTFSFASAQVFLDSLLSNGFDDERPHQLYSAEERRYLELDKYDNSWVIPIGGAGDFIVDEQSMLALFSNNFYEFYHNAELDFSSPLKRKKFEVSDEFTEWKEEMLMQREYVISDTLHMPLEGHFREPIQYDVNKGGFIISPYHPSIYSNSKFLIPSNLTKFFENPRLSFDFFCRISNEDIALDMENTDRYGPYKYDFLVRFRFLENPPINNTKLSNKGNSPQVVSLRTNDTSYFEIVDIILYKTTNKQVVWSMLLGDLSESVK